LTFYFDSAIIITERTKERNPKMREWNELTDEEQVRLWWEYDANSEEEISFSEFDEMMQGIYFE
jgi:hypothetical protein